MCTVRWGHQQGADGICPKITPGQTSGGCQEAAGLGLQVRLPQFRCRCRCIYCLGNIGHQTVVKTVTQTGKAGRQADRQTGSVGGRAGVRRGPEGAGTRTCHSAIPGRSRNRSNRNAGSSRPGAIASTSTWSVDLAFTANHGRWNAHGRVLARLVSCRGPTPTWTKGR